MWKLPKCPSMDEWMKMKWHIRTMEYYYHFKKERGFNIDTEQKLRKKYKSFFKTNKKYN